MEEPEDQERRAYAYRPNVANWLESTILATHPDNSTSDPSEREPDSYYRSFQGHSDDIDTGNAGDMTTTTRRQRPGGTNGATSRIPAARTTPKVGFRSASGPASSMAAKATPSLPLGSRPPVKSLVQKFNQPTSSEGNVLETRTTRSPAASRSTTSLSQNSTPPSARTTKEASYGAYKFNNLKPRERPQPAPSTPGSNRRINGGRSTLDAPTASSIAKQASPVKAQKRAPSRTRKPFFGEVIGDPTNTQSPGFGIPAMEGVQHVPSGAGGEVTKQMDVEIDSEASNFTPRSTHTRATHSQQNTPSSSHHNRTRSNISGTSTADSLSAAAASLGTTQRRPSPQSKIPLPNGRASAASDSSSSLKSASTHSRLHPGTTPVKSKYSVPASKESSPRRLVKTPPVVTLSAKRYGGSPHKGASNGASLTAVIRAPPPQTSPRLRNSRERQSLSKEGPASLREQDYTKHSVIDADGYFNHPESALTDANDTVEAGMAASWSASGDPVDFVDHVGDLVDPTGSVDDNSSLARVELPGDRNRLASEDLQSLTLNTLNLLPPQEAEPLTSTTEFEGEESPILGMPGGFAMTPPMAQETSRNVEEEISAVEESASTPLGKGTEALAPETLRQIGKGREAALRDVEHMGEEQPRQYSQMNSMAGSMSEFDARESVPIFLRDTPMMVQNRDHWQAPDQSSCGVISGSQAWRSEPLDLTGSIAYLHEEESPIDPYENRFSVRPEDSISVAHGHKDQVAAPTEWTPDMPSLRDGGLTLDSEAYSVINRVLEHYHNSSVVTPEMAHGFQQEVHAVSPSLAQHKDWDSKEATETYLARLLSDANVYQEDPVYRPPSPIVPAKTGKDYASMDFGDLDDPSDAEYTGTAIIYTQPRRYSEESATTTIWDDGSGRADTSSETRDRSQQNGQGEADHEHDRLYRPAPPPKDRRQITFEDPSFDPSRLYSLHSREDEGSFTSSSTHQPLLPEIEGAGEGLGLAIPPPVPAYSPPPPPSTHTANHSEMGNLLSVERLNEGGRRLSAFFRGDAPRDDAADETRPLIQRVQSNGPVAATPSTVYTANPPSSILPNEPLPQSVVQTDIELDPQTKRLIRRRYIMHELFITEASFARDMVVLQDIYQGTISLVDQLTEQERKIIFGNLDDVIAISKKLLFGLRAAVAPVLKLRKSEWSFKMKVTPSSSDSLSDDEPPTEENDRQTTVGCVLLEHLVELERVYSEYIRNHAQANKVLEGAKDKPKVKLWMEECRSSASDLTEAWSLDSLLVKPTQRLAKYPLLLEDLLKVTPEGEEDGHPDRHHIEEASTGIRTILERINQHAKRMQLVEKMMGGKSQKSNAVPMSTFLKAFGRRTDKFKQQAGFFEKVDDPEYDSIAQRFGGHFFQLQIVMRDIENYLDAITKHMNQYQALAVAFIGMCEAAGQTNSHEIESQWRKYALAVQELCQIALPDHRQKIRDGVVEPICELWIRHDKPQSLMEKRKKHVVDYIKWKQAVDKGEKVDKKMQDSADAWVACNDMLKMELPELYALTKKLISICMTVLVAHQQNFHATCEMKLCSFVEPFPKLDPTPQMAYERIIRTFNSDFGSIDSQASMLAICNKSLVLDIGNFMSPVASFYTDDSNSRKSTSKRTQSVGSDIANDNHQRLSGGFSSGFSSVRPSTESAPQLDGGALSPVGRYRAGSSYSGKQPISPRSDSTNRTVTASNNQSRPSTGVSASVSYQNAAPVGYANGLQMRDMRVLPPPTNAFPQQRSPSSRGSGVFSSALPMPDSPSANRTEEVAAGLGEVRVIFLAASLFEFNIAHDRQEGGYPYLVYVPGEIFDVIGMKGELWLARNQDDKSGTIGWIWEKHFARILPDEDS